MRPKNDTSNKTNTAKKTKPLHTGAAFFATFQKKDLQVTKNTFYICHVKTVTLVTHETGSETRKKNERVR